MAILTGFPPSNMISPSVRIAEVDLSFITTPPTGHNAGLVGFASKGPINTPTIVTTVADLNTQFGYPHPDVGDPYLIYAATQYLQFGNELYIVRVGDNSATSDTQALTASTNVTASGTPAQIESNTAGPYTFDVDRFFRWRLNGTLASKVLVVLSDANRPSPDTGNPYTVTDLVNSLNLQLVPAIDGIQFYWTHADSTTGAATSESCIAVETTFSYGPSASVEMVSVQDAMYGEYYNGTDFVAPFTGLGQGMLPATITGTYDRYPNNSSQVAGVFDFSGLTGLDLNIVIDGSDNILIDQVLQVVSINSDSETVADIAADINAQIVAGDIPGGFVAQAVSNHLVLSTLFSGEDAALLVKSDSTAAALFGLGSSTNVGVSPSGVTGNTGSPDYDSLTYTYGIVTGAANNTGIICFTLTADSPGIDGNQTQVIINSNVLDGTFSFSVFSYGNQVEAWGNLVKNESSNYYVETFINLVSDYLRVIDNTNTVALPLNGTYQLSGGTDGIPADPDTQDSLLVGTTSSMTGLNALSDTEQVDIDLIAIPGHPSTTNIVGLLNFCQNVRGDCFAIVEPPFGLSVTEIVQWQNGVHPLNDVRFNSDFGALYWPWVMIRDTFNQVDVWVPPAGVVLGCYANSDSLSAPWFAPAGTTRGVLPTVENVFSRPTLAERDSMYGNENAVNPIIQFPDLGNFLVFGQKTLQRTPSALDRVNVRRMMLYIEKQIKAACRPLIFEPNDQTLWTRFIAIANGILGTVQQGRGLYAYMVQCDATLNTPGVIDQNELRANIGVQPTITAEFIFIQFTINSTGNFAESSAF
jgi:uncharacterized protein